MQSPGFIKKIMSDLKTVKNGSVDKNTRTRPDLDGEEWRDSSFYKPISAREYFKLLGYCMIGLVVVGLFISLFFDFTGYL